eukprot:c19724_g1_i3.p1 GENE.c19724_g1_i3~~c19724_g1_i3.p1  ORF type:complete len:448 (-),score=186.20 c19724_g1_i3:333-1634(-)
MQTNILKKCTRIISAFERQRLDEFKTFLSFKTTQEGKLNGDNWKAVHFLEKIAQRIGLNTQIFELAKNKPILLATWKGEQENNTTILLNSHYDVVPAVNEMWKTDPFVPHEDEDGNIFARGAQDMKCVCMMYLFALEKMRLEGKKPLRTINVLFVPDEEVGGVEGMQRFVETETFKNMNIGVALDEGLANETDKFTLFYGEKAALWAMVDFNGDTGHGSRLMPNTAIEKLAKFLERVYKFREEQQKKLGGFGCAHAAAAKLGDVVSVNVTMVEAGMETQNEDGTRSFALNVVPNKCIAGFDMRIPPQVPIEEMEKTINEWTKEEGVSWTVTKTPPHHSASSTECVWWKVIQQRLTSLGYEFEAEIFPAATDSRHLRKKNVKAFGFSPLNRTTVLLHDHNEMINSEVFLNGIDIYVDLITNLSNLSTQEESESK